jgi:hypothetical protein
LSKPKNKMQVKPNSCCSTWHFPLVKSWLFSVFRSWSEENLAISLSRWRRRFRIRLSCGF